MADNPKIYYLNNKDYSTIKDLIDFDTNTVLRERVAIYNHTSNPADNYYILISVDHKIDKIIEDNGGIKASSNDFYKTIMKEGKHNGDFIYGNEKLICLLT